MRFVTLLVTLVATLLLLGLLGPRAVGLPSLQLFFSAIFVAGVYAISGHRRVLVAGLAIALAALVTTWWRQLSTQPGPVLVGADYASDLLFFAFVAWTILRAVLQERRVTADTIFGGICVYILLGVVWTVCFSAIEFFAPGSFALGEKSVTALALEAGERAPFQELLYFSFVTLTTLGYGDIRPTANFARTLATAEAVVGQLFVAVFIARLVALELVHASRGDA